LGNPALNCSLVGEGAEGIDVRLGLSVSVDGRLASEGKKMLVQGRTPRGFSLVEVLIGVGIIALLVGVLVPTVSRARAAARLVQCTNNLQQINTSFRVWGQSREMRLPSVATWVGAVTSIGKTDDILFCPDGPEASGPSAFGDGPIIDYHPNNNKGHPTTPTKINDDHFKLTTTYQKNKPEMAEFDFVRIEGNLWKMTPTRIDPRRPYGGPPIDVYSSDGTVLKDVQIGQSYNVYIGDAGTGGATYGFNAQMGLARTPKTGRVLAVDYDTAKLTFDASGNPAGIVPARHQKTRANVLFTDGSVQLVEAKELQQSPKMFDPKP
jgi:prepilin-type N-terminal cleavage/methylation domain-containing protein/prepilin-type processing-associated H-X9-DG protein